MCKLPFQTHVSESRWWFGDAFRLKQSYVHAAFICLGSLTAKADFVTLYQTRRSRAGSLHRYPRFPNNATWPRFEKVWSQCSLQTWTRACQHRASTAKSAHKWQTSHPKPPSPPAQNNSTNVPLEPLLLRLSSQNYLNDIACVLSGVCT